MTHYGERTHGNRKPVCGGKGRWTPKRHRVDCGYCLSWMEAHPAPLPADAAPPAGAAPTEEEQEQWARLAQIANNIHKARRAYVDGRIERAIEFLERKAPLYKHTGQEYAYHAEALEEIRGMLPEPFGAYGPQPSEYAPRSRAAGEHVHRYQGEDYGHRHTLPHDILPADYEHPPYNLTKGEPIPDGMPDKPTERPAPSGGSGGLTLVDVADYFEEQAEILFIAEEEEARAEFLRHVRALRSLANVLLR